MIPWIIGGVLLALIAKKLYPHKQPSQADMQAIAQAQAQAIAKARQAMGIKQANPAQGALDKALGAIGISRGGGPSTAAPSNPPHVMQGDPLNTVQGKQYWVTLVTHGAANSAGRDTIIQEATNRGFTDVVPSPAKPNDWPGGMNGDWYIKAKAARSAQFARNKGTPFAGVTLVEVFEA